MSGEKEQTKSAAARDFLEALEEQQIVDEIEIKQEIVLDPNEWVPAQFCSDQSSLVTSFF